MERKTRADRATSSQHGILNAALELFAQHGYHGTSLQAIADLAGVNKALLFYYFKNKANLFDQAFQAPQREFLDKLAKKAPRIPDPKKRLEFLINEYIKIFERKRELLQIALSEAASTNVSSRDRMRKFIDYGLRPIEEAISYGIKKGIFVEIDPRMGAVFLMGMLRIFGIYEKITEHIFEAEEVARYARKIFLEGIIKHQEKEDNQK
ncbi:MAG: TetR/AcrR family transcriptional regulator [Candidatus Eremiobacteraeota bacterium]|nr:TetR/AcrR family transcriptional regulator [Candidatus Eremiobacteraeota bacterium]